MRLTFKLSLVTLLFLSLVACSKKSPADSGPALPATAAGLAGTTWKLDAVLVTFHKNGKLALHVSDKITAQGDYTVKKGIIEMDFLGHVKAGIWDGRHLVVDGMDGVRVKKKPS